MEHWPELGLCTEVFFVSLEYRFDEYIGHKNIFYEMHKIFALLSFYAFRASFNIHTTTPSFSS